MLVRYADILITFRCSFILTVANIILSLDLHINVPIESRTQPYESQVYDLTISKVTEIILTSHKRLRSYFDRILIYWHPACRQCLAGRCQRHATTMQRHQMDTIPVPEYLSQVPMVLVPQLDSVGPSIQSKLANLGPLVPVYKLVFFVPQLVCISTSFIRLRYTPKHHHDALFGPTTSTQLVVEHPSSVTLTKLISSYGFRSVVR